MIANGELRSSRLLRALPTIPGSASGRTWLGQTNPQLACELPLANAPRSIKVTFQPDRIKKYAHDVPITPLPMTIAVRRRDSWPDPHREGIGRVDDQRRLGVDVGRAADLGSDPTLDDPCRAFEQAADDALLPPDLSLGELAVGDQAGKLGAGAGAARGAVVGPAGAQHEVLAVGIGPSRWTEQLDMVDLATVGAADALSGQGLANAPGDLV